jgi:hypothetical protein
MSEVQGPIAISRDTNSVVWTSTGNQNRFGPRLLSCPLSSRGHVEQSNNNRTFISLFLLKETEAFLPRNYEARTYEQRPSSSFLKARESHREFFLGGGKERKRRQLEPREELEQQKQRIKVKETSGERGRWKVKIQRRDREKTRKQRTKNERTKRQEN